MKSVKLSALFYFSLVPAFVTTAYVCHHTILHVSYEPGEFTSPGYPFGYPNNLYCTWTLQAPEGYQVEVNFGRILTESCCDTIELRDGNSSSAGLVATYRGNASVSIYASSFGSLYIRFRSDDSYVYDGFQAEYRIATTKTDQCQEELSAFSYNRSLGSPGWPTSYASNLLCRWTLKAPKKKRVAITFISVDTESCCDYVLIRYGDTMESEVHELGGSIEGVMPQYVSTGETAQIIFRSDSSVERRGFYAIYSAVDVKEAEKSFTTREEKCSKRLTVPLRGHQALTTPRYPNTHPNNLKCVWILIAPVNARVMLWFTSVHTEACCDFVKIRDGESSTSTKIGVLSGKTTLFASFISTSNTLRVEFESDMTTSKRGFRAIYELFQDFSKQVCGGFLHAVLGRRKYISSPNWPMSPSQTQCIWKISSPPGTSVLFSVIGFNTDRFRDELVFYDGHSQTSPLVAIMTGRSTRTRYISSSNTLLVIFNSDFTSTEGGFRGLYKAISLRDSSPQPAFEEGTTAEINL